MLTDPAIYRHEAIVVRNKGTAVVLVNSLEWCLSSLFNFSISEALDTFSACWVILVSSKFRNPPKSDMDCRLFGLFM